MANKIDEFTCRKIADYLKDHGETSSAELVEDYISAIIRARNE